jgi:hypothetical protein
MTPNDLRVRLLSSMLHVDDLRIAKMIHVAPDRQETNLLLDAENPIATVMLAAEPGNGRFQEAQFFYRMGALQHGSSLPASAPLSLGSRLWRAAATTPPRFACISRLAPHPMKM